MDLFIQCSTFSCIHSYCPDALCCAGVSTLSLRCTFYTGLDDAYSIINIRSRVSSVSTHSATSQRHTPLSAAVGSIVGKQFGLRMHGDQSGNTSTCIAPNHCDTSDCSDHSSSISREVGGDTNSSGSGHIGSGAEASGIAAAAAAVSSAAAVLAVLSLAAML
eukprot:TRINITY_DN103295_c0_g1_i1.p1 TRINITY_DN103295_c0_g1~~TRINITY_DN103295_c0_g1_i1.p1  ORF type:complete len:162 (+),score=9.59 TRINITY_DN103295_c0_g1_i1:552-1037(+)